MDRVLIQSTPAHETPSKISSHTVQPGLRIIIYFAREIGIESSPLEVMEGEAIALLEVIRWITDRGHLKSRGVNKRWCRLYNMGMMITDSGNWVCICRCLLRSRPNVEYYFV